MQAWYVINPRPDFVDLEIAMDEGAMPPMVSCCLMFFVKPHVLSQGPVSQHAITSTKDGQSNMYNSCLESIVFWGTQVLFIGQPRFAKERLGEEADLQKFTKKVSFCFPARLMCSKP